MVEGVNHILRLILTKKISTFCLIFVNAVTCLILLFHYNRTSYKAIKSWRFFDKKYYLFLFVIFQSYVIFLHFGIFIFRNFTIFKTGAPRSYQGRCIIFIEHIQSFTRTINANSRYFCNVFATHIPIRPYNVVNICPNINRTNLKPYENNASYLKQKLEIKESTHSISRYLPP